MSQENNVIPMPEENTGLVVQDNSKNMALPELSAESIMNFDDSTQLAIQSLSAQIDVTQTDKVNSYAEIPLQKGISESMEFLKRMKGTEEDRQTVKIISDLSEKVNNEINDIKIVAKERGLIDRIFDFFRGDPHDNTLKKIDSCNNLIEELSEHMDREIEILSVRKKDADNIIETSTGVVESLDQYLVAGYIAEKRIREDIKTKQDSSSLMIRDQIELAELKSGIELFSMNLSNLNKTRLATYLSLVETYATKNCLAKLEENFSSTKQQLLLIFGQQATNALLAYTVKNAVDSHNDITKMNTALMESNARSIHSNYEGVAKLLTTGVADIDKMKQCAAAILEGAQKHNEIISEYVDHLDEHKKQINEALEPVRKFFGNSEFPEETTVKSTSSTNSTGTSSGSLKF